MSAVEGTTEAGGSGKSIHDSALSVDDATRATLPHLPYADAVHAALAEVVMVPDLLETGVRQEHPRSKRELFLRLQWLPGHDDLVPAAAQADGLTVEWSHLAGWSVRCGDALAVLDVDELADPATVAEAAMHAALCGLDCTCEKPPAGRWDQALVLDIALVHFDERETRTH
ncbi:hypothetical protein O3S80_16155 [Streptomyces sp. Lzd4kr]|nr:hypothetical protein [Streptomyces sp. Lzd4kr]